MEATIKLGLVGRGISYSFSEKYFKEKFKKLFLKNYSYQTFDLQDIEEIDGIFSIENLKGFNVTIPFKEKIIPFLDKLSEEAEIIKAVNTVVKKGNRWVGYNTDAFGFAQTLKIHQKKHQKKALILGNGGASKAVKFVLDQNQIPSEIISRTTEINYENLPESLVCESQIIVQCTPVGTYPNVEDCLKFPFQSLTNQHLVIDLIYNPSYTQFIKNASKEGAKCVNGYYMLEQQAEKAWQIWNEK